MPASFLGCLRLHGHEPRISVARDSFLLEQLGWENPANRQKETHTKEKESSLQYSSFMHLKVRFTLSIIQQQK